MKTWSRHSLSLVVGVIVIAGLLIYTRFFREPQVAEWGEARTRTENALAAWQEMVLGEQADDDARDQHPGYWICSDLQTVRAQLELYKMQHGGKYPEDLVKAMTTSDGMYGPYLAKFPANPLVKGANSDKVDTTSPGGSTAGWFYNPKTGVVCPDDDWGVGVFYPRR